MRKEIPFRLGKFRPLGIFNMTKLNKNGRLQILIFFNIN
jgi:hypothetical protein